MPFSMEWVEEYLDLGERNEAKDPLYAAEKSSRNERRTRFLRQISQGTIKVHLIASQKGHMVASARAILIPSCGDDASKIATLALMVDPAHRRKGIGTRLVDRVCEELESQSVKGLELGTMDSWEDMERFLAKRGFASCFATADVALCSDAPFDEKLPEVDAVIRPIRLPGEGEKVTEFYNRERGRDMPMECKLTPEWWEIGPGSKIEPDSFFIAEDRKSGQIIGTVWGSIFSDKLGVHGMIDMLDVENWQTRAALRRRLLVQIIKWLRARGVVDVQTRVHMGYRGEEELYESLRFEVKASAKVWRRLIPMKKV